MRVCEGRECGEEGAFKNGKGDACWFTVIRRKTTVESKDNRYTWRVGLERI